MMPFHSDILGTREYKRFTFKEWINYTPAKVEDSDAVIRNSRREIAQIEERLKGILDRKIEIEDYIRFNVEIVE